MEHPDFRVGGRIFASLDYPEADWGMVTLPVEEQARVCAGEPEVFVPAKGAWGRGGSTLVRLKVARAAVLRAVLKAAYDERVRKNGAKGVKGAKGKRSSLA
jgi:hypothetical protein